MGGCWDTENESPKTVGDATDMQLLCYQTRESPSSGKCSIFCYRLTYISKMFSMHTKHFYWGGIAVILIGSYLPPEFPFFHGWGLRPHVSFTSTWQLSSSPRLQWQHVISGQWTLMWWCMEVCIQYHCDTITMSAKYPPIPITWLWCQYPHILTNWPPSSSQFQPDLGVIIVRASLNSIYSSTQDL